MCQIVVALASLVPNVTKQPFNLYLSVAHAKQCNVSIAKHI